MPRIPLIAVIISLLVIAPGAQSSPNPGPPGGTAHLDWHGSHRKVCMLGNNSIIREQWTAPASPGMVSTVRTLVIITSLNGDVRIREDMQIPISDGKKYLWIGGRWVTYDGAVDADRENYFRDLPIAMGMSIEDLIACASSFVPMK